MSSGDDRNIRTVFVAGKQVYPEPPAPSQGKLENDFVVCFECYFAQSKECYFNKSKGMVRVVLTNPREW